MIYAAHLLHVLHDSHNGVVAVLCMCWHCVYRHHMDSSAVLYITCTRGLVHKGYRCWCTLCVLAASVHTLHRCILQIDELDVKHDSHTALCMTGTSRAKLREMYNELGDMGDVAQACRHTQASSCCLPTTHASPQKPYPAMQ